MAATFYERCLRIGDYENDGGIVDLDALRVSFILYSDGLVNAAWVKTTLGCTGTAQENDCQDILDTLPVVVLVLSAAERAAWPHKVNAIFTAGVMGVGFTTEALCKTALGI